MGSLCHRICLNRNLFICVISVIFMNQAQSCNINQEFQNANSELTITCNINPYSGGATWTIEGVGQKTSCLSGGFCDNVVDGNYTFTSDVNGIYVKIDPYTSVDEKVIWVCEHSSTAAACNITTLEIPKSQTLSTHLTPTSGVAPPDGGINSLNSISNSPDETMTFSSIYLAITETSSLIFQTSASSDVSPYYVSNTYTPTYLMSTLTTNILGSSFSLPFASSGAFIGDYGESSLESIFDTMTSDLSIFSANSDLYSSNSIIDVLEANVSSLSKMYGVEISYQPSLSPSFASNLAELSTQTLLYKHSMQSPEMLTIPTTLTNPDTSSIPLTTFTPDETSTLYLSSKYTTSVDLKSSFDFDSNTKTDTIRTSTSKFIEAVTLNSIAESHEIKSARISMSYDYSSSMLINSRLTSFESTPGTLIERPTMVEIITSMDSFYETFEDKSGTLSVNFLQTQSLKESTIFGTIMNTSVKTSNENTDTFFESLWIASSVSFNHVHESLSLHSGLGSDSDYKATSSANSVLFGSFSISPDKDSNNVLSTTSDIVLWSRDVSRISLESLSRVGSPFYDSTAYISTKDTLSLSVNHGRYSSANNTHISQPKDFELTILPSASKYFYSSDIDTSSYPLVSSSVSANHVLTDDPSLTKTSKVIAISVTVVGCIFFVAITILVLFVLKFLRCKPKSKVSKTNKKFSSTDSYSTQTISKRGRHGLSLFDRPYGLPTRYYNKTATSLGLNDGQFTSNYNKNWDDIT